MLSRKNQILELDEIKKSIRYATTSNNLVCIGVDGPTASGKTIFAEILKEKISNISDKKVQIVPLDGLLIDRIYREKSLQTISNIGIPFEHEAEIHMRFSKFDDLLNLIRIRKKNLSKISNIILNNLYSRSDKGKCSGKLNINLSNKTVLIFEGHYTTRPEFEEVLDINFILLANRDELIKRKINRVANYRNKSEVVDYFELIDEPSYLSNYYRFASEESKIIDNTNFLNPFSVNYNHINNLLNTEKFLNTKRISSNKIKEFIFGLHGLSNYDEYQTKDFQKLLSDLNNIEIQESTKSISNLFNINRIEHEIIYFDFINRNRIEIGLITKLFRKNIFWIISKAYGIKKHLISWEGGIFKIENGFIEKLSFLKEETFIGTKQKEDFWQNHLDGKAFISSILIEKSTNLFNKAHCFLEDSIRVSYLATALKYTQYKCKSLGDFFAISLRGTLEENIERITSIPSTFKVNKFSFSKGKEHHFYKKTKDYFLTSDFFILYKKLNKEIVMELEEIYFKSNDQNLRSAIFTGLLNEENEPFIPELIRNHVKYSIGFLPISMSRLYILRRMGLEESNVLAANIYDISQDPIDSTAYIKGALENFCPTILQISLNAAGQSEIDSNGSMKIGYLQPEKGINDFTNSISEAIVNILEKSDFKTDNPPLIGIGLDHVDVRGNNPAGRTSRFLKEALNTECITHITLDGSENFKPRNKNLDEIFNAYVKVFKTALGFLEKNNIKGIDLEFCTGELNYIGNESTPHYPDGKEMALLPICFSTALSGEKDQIYNVNLLNYLKLYVGNLGTTHHGNDEENSLKIHLANDWQKYLEGTNFISPVLHGTTGSTTNTFKLASKSCQKINIAGSFLRILLDNLDNSQKEVLDYSVFDAKSKFLCSKLGLIKKSQLNNVHEVLKSEFVRYCNINDVKSISKRNEKFVRKTLYGRNKISKYIFLKLYKILS